MVELKAKGILSIGTLRADRLWDCKHLPEKEMMKKDRGSFDFHVDANSGVCVLQWFDNRIMRVASTYYGAIPASDVQKWSRKEKRMITISRPFMILEYNQKMGRVDKFDMLMELYRIERRNKKYYMRISTGPYNFAISMNGFSTNVISSLRELGSQGIRKGLIEFILLTAERLKAGWIISRKRGRPCYVPITPEASPSQPRKRAPTYAPPLKIVRYVCVNHWPVSGNKLGCRLCEEKRAVRAAIKKALSQVACSKYKVALCFRSEKDFLWTIIAD